MKVLITGGTGFIGRPLLQLLTETSADVHATSRQHQSNSNLITWHRTDLLDPGASRSLVSGLEPDSILHLAWEATPGEYLNSSLNQRWVDATEELFAAFVETGGRRFVGVGSMLEYAPGHEVCDEELTPSRPQSPYGVAKLRAASSVLQAGRESPTTSCWARIFHIYGPGEPRAKLISHIATHLIRGERAPLTLGAQVRDFIFVKDAVSALDALLHSDIEGVVNIGTGEGSSVRSIATLIGEKLGRPDLLGFGEIPLDGQSNPRVIAAVHKLKSLGWEPKVRVEEGVELTIQALT